MPVGFADGDTVSVGLRLLSKAPFVWHVGLSLLWASLEIFLSIIVKDFVAPPYVAAQLPLALLRRTEGKAEEAHCFSLLQGISYIKHLNRFLNVIPSHFLYGELGSLVQTLYLMISLKINEI